MTAVCTDELVFVYDSVVRKVLAKKGNKPRIMMRGSHKKTFKFLTVAMDSSTLFRSLENANSKIFISYMNRLKREYRKYILFYGGAPWHTSGDVEEFMKKTGRQSSL